jgi:NAD(P)-dependent dehydrogenase (short-subunit alcohol dehydrogenase family)
MLTCWNGRCSSGSLTTCAATTSWRWRSKSVPTAALPLMRRQRDGLIVNISSWSGRHHGYVAGVPYSASKYAVVSLNESLNIAEGRYGIRACVICPGEIATPILERRPVKLSDAQKSRMLQPDDLAQTILFLARLPARACVNEILLSPTQNRAYQNSPDRFPPPVA